MDSEALQRENTLLRTVLDQRDQIKALEEQVDRQHSANSKFVQIIYTMCNNGIGRAKMEHIQDFHRGEWHVYSFYFDLVKLLVPDLVEKHPEFGVIATKMEEWHEAIREAAKGEE
jgi:DNA-binding GntR family transcriptional regulator